MKDYTVCLSEQWHHTSSEGIDVEAGWGGKSILDAHIFNTHIY